VSPLHEKLVDFSKKHQIYIGCHGYEHTERVIKICNLLGIELSADMDVLIPGAILHDIGRVKDQHAQQSAVIARKILEELDYPKVDDIVHVIDVHSFSGGGEAKTLEAKILSDADKLDAMGAMGIYRAAQYSVEHESPQKEFINHFQEKLLKLKDLLYTNEAKKLAEKRHRFMFKYLVQLEEELKYLG
jgi:uncharacterized protein